MIGKQKSGVFAMKRFLIFFLLLCLLFAISGCGKSAPSADSVQKQELEAITTGGLYQAAEDESYRLMVDLDELNIYVEDKLTGRRFASNPADVENDPVAGEEYKAYMQSQFEISYVYGRNVRSANSYEDCVEKGQYEVFRIDHGVRIEYTLGDLSLTWEDIPQQLSAARAAELVLEHDGVTDEQKELFQACFEQQPDGSYLRLSNVFGSKQTELIDLFAAIGYTQDDLRADCMEFDIPFEAEEKVGFLIPVEYTLNDGWFRASVIMEDAVYPNDSPILQLGLLPFFGAYQQGEKGYTFLPDGSGVVLDFDSQTGLKTDLAVYHPDASIGEPSAPSSAQPVLMPVFGMKGNTDAFLAVIEQGDAVSVIHASPAGSTSNYHTVYAGFTTCAEDTMDLSSVTTVPTAVNVYQQELVRSPLTVAYCFLKGEDADYSGMAHAYRNYLTAGKEFAAVPETVPFYLEAIGAIESSKNFMGINYTGITPLTTYENTREMAEYFQSQGIGTLCLRLSGWYGSGIIQSIPKKVKSIGSLGSEKELEALCQDYELYLDVSFLSLDTAKGISPSGDAAKMLDQQYVRTWLSEDKKGYLISVRRLPSLMESVLKQISGYNKAGLSIRDLGNAAFADYDKSEETDRQEGAALVADSLQSVSEAGKAMMLERANMRNVLYGRHIMSVPVGGSSYRTGEKDVPFYQMVIHGLVSYCVPPLNLSSTHETDLLKAIEYGAGLSYQLSYTDLTELNGVLAPELFSVYYQNWMDDAVKKQKVLSNALNGLNAVQITEHAYLSSDCTMTTYANGTRIVVNASDKAVSAEGKTVAPYSFVRLDQ